MIIQDWDTHKKLLLKRPDVRKALQDNELEHAIARELIEARIKRKITQLELSRKIGTKQSVVSRMESGSSTPSVSLLKRVAHALGAKLEIRFSF